MRKEHKIFLPQTHKSLSKKTEHIVYLNITINTVAIVKHSEIQRGMMIGGKIFLYKK